MPGRFTAKLQIGSKVPYVEKQPAFWHSPTVKSAATVEMPVLLLAANPIRGRVRDATGAPVANAYITILWKTEIKLKSDVGGP